MAAHKAVLVHPKPGVTIFLPGASHGFRTGPVPMREDHADLLADHLIVEEEPTPAPAAEHDGAQHG